MSHGLFVGIILFFASFTLGTAGFGFALVSVPLLALVVSPRIAVPLVVVYSNGINFFLLLRFRDHIEWPKLWPLLVGVLPGIPLGICLLKNTEDIVIRKIVGAVVIGFILWNLFTRTQRSQDLSRFWAVLAGFMSGILTGASAMGGPPVLMYLTLTQWEKNLTRATLQSFFFITGTCALLGLTLERLLTLDVLRFNLLYLPSVILGSVMGYIAFKRISSERFRKMLVYLLLAIGLFLIVS
jgi:hypothetical protein